MLIFISPEEKEVQLFVQHVSFPQKSLVNIINRMKTDLMETDDINIITMW
jgi:hypothetical protein